MISSRKGTYTAQAFVSRGDITAGSDQARSHRSEYPDAGHFQWNPSSLRESDRMRYETGLNDTKNAEALYNSIG